MLYIKKIINKTRLIFLLLAIFTLAMAADKNHNANLAKRTRPTEGPIVENNYKWHTAGRLWNRVTNYGMLGDDAYEDRSPSCDYPGGSGNSYLYRGSLWLSGFVDGEYHVSKVDDSEYSPIDTVHQLTGDDAQISDSDIWTRYYDVKAPLAAGHFPLGIEITERSYAWSASYASDFIIYEYTIKNVGIDSDGDGYPDTEQTVDDFYFTMRLDGDVSKLNTWDAEYAFSNQDDITMANGQPWDWVEHFPQMAGNLDLLDDAPVDSSMVFMFDGDNPDVDADNGEADDFGNPSADGTLQTPGFLVYRILKTEPQMPKHSFHQCNIYNDPTSDKETWDRMIGVPEFEPLLLINDEPFPYDYRGILTYGPLDQLAPGDSVVVTTALGVGADLERGGIHSLLDMIKDMDVAQFMVDNNYEISADALSPGAPDVEVAPYVEDNITTGIKIEWNKDAASHSKFESFVVSKGRKTGSGSISWEPLAVYTDTAGSATWPPEENDNGNYQLIDRDITNGLVYYYSVQTRTEDVQYPIPFGVIESNITDEKSFNVISPSNPEAEDNLDRVKVVPNPYVGSAKWNNPTPSGNTPWEHRLQFTNLPSDAEIKIFTLDGDYVAKIYANETVIAGSDVDISTASVAEWDLMTRNNQEAAPGIYMFVVESKSLGTKTGKFVIVR